MMRNRGRMQGRGGFRAKRPTQWVGGNAYNASTGLVSLTQSNLELCGSTSSGFDPPGIDRFTVERVRGQVIVNWLPNAVSEVCHLDMGIIAVTDSATAAGIVPSPSTQADSGAHWLWLQHAVYSAGGINVQQGVLATCPAYFDIDVKSKRVFREDMTLYLAVLASFTAGGSCQLNSFLRTLISRVA